MVATTATTATKSVPTAAQVAPGQFVHIILKEDQPTGRRVVGTVKHILTRGDHPRGIKVRLVDGRVGRVQSLATEGEAVVANSDGGLGVDAGEAQMVFEERQRRQGWRGDEEGEPGRWRQERLST